MYKIVLSCLGVPESEGAAGAVAIEEEFSHRLHYQNVTCSWKDGRLVLQAENDFDARGEALAHEFSDAVCACIPGTFGFKIQIESVVSEAKNA